MESDAAGGQEASDYGKKWRGVRVMKQIVDAHCDITCDKHRPVTGSKLRRLS